MARKQRTGDSSEVYFDTRTKAVLTQSSHNSMANVKGQVASVREVVPHCRKEDILLVLQHFDSDVPSTIQAFMEDGAEEILKEWNIPNKRKTGNNMNKKNKKKKPKQPITPQEEDGVITNGLQEGHISNNNNIEKAVESKMEAASSTKVDEKQPKANPQQSKPAVTPEVQQTHQPQERHQVPKSVNSPKHQRKPQQHANNSNKKTDGKSEPGGHPGGSQQNKSQEPKEKRQTSSSSQSKTPSKGLAATGSHSNSNKSTSVPTVNSRTGREESGQRSGQAVAAKHGQSSEGSGKRERTVSESNSLTDPSRSKKTGSTLDKSTKDLQRTAVSLTRHKYLLAEEIDKAEKRMKKAFDDARKSLSTKEEELMKQLQEVKRQATSFLDERQHKAFELKQETNRAASKTDHELLELRADIKHFVSERKIDEEIGRTPRFTGNLDPLQSAIKDFGEVIPVKTVYSTRRPSLTSLTSVESLSRPTSISDNPGGMLSRSASTLEGSVEDGHAISSVPVTPTSPDVDMDSVAKMAAKMQRSLQTQGQRGRGPRNPRQQANNSRQGQQGGNPRQGQSAKEGSRQDQHGNRGNPTHQNSQRSRPHNEKSPNERSHDKPHNERSQQGGRNDRPRNDRGDGGRGKDDQGPRNKDRIIRRREQYRRRHDQEGSPEKEGTSPVQRPNSIPIPQNVPSTAPVDKKPAPAVNGNISTEAHQDTKPEKTEPKTQPDKKIVPLAHQDTKPENSEPKKQPDKKIIPLAHQDTKPEKTEPKKQPDVKTTQHLKNKIDIPLVNGNASSSSAETTPTEALPQRKPRENRNRKKAAEVAKEVPAVNGIVNGETTPVMVNGES